MTSIERTPYPRFGRVVLAGELDALCPLADEVDGPGGLPVVTAQFCTAGSSCNVWDGPQRRPILYLVEAPY